MATRRTIRSQKAYAVLSSTPKPLVLEIENDVVTVREKGSRQRFSISFDRLLQEAIIETTASKEDLFSSHE